MSAFHLPLLEKAIADAIMTGEGVDGCFRCDHAYDVYFFVCGVYVGLARWSAKTCRWRASRPTSYPGLNRVTTSGCVGEEHPTWGHAGFVLTQPYHRALDQAVDILRRSGIGGLE